MATYIILNCLFVMTVCVVLKLKPRRPSRAWLAMFAGLLILTAVFDSVNIAHGIYSYNPAKLLGVYVGWAPIEDFFYSLLAAILVPTVWQLMGRGRDD